MTTYRIISDIKIEHDIEAESEQEALDKHANDIELPKEYVESSWELDKVFVLCGNCSREIDEETGIISEGKNRCERCKDM